MILSLVRKFRARQRLQGSMGWLLRREDNHLLDDIGMTRAELGDLLRDPPVDERHRFRARAQLLAGGI
ncbi:MAG: hypothetical protein ABI832_14045 [bacterium]